VPEVGIARDNAEKRTKVKETTERRKREG